MQWQIPVHVIAPEAPRRLPWDARSPLGSGSPNAAADPVRFEAKADALQLAHRVLEAALADEALRKLEERRADSESENTFNPRPEVQ